MKHFTIKSAETYDQEASSELPSKRALKDKEASRYIGMSESWLRHGRIEGSRFDNIPRPPFIKIGRSVRYLVEDLDAWLENFRRFDHLAEVNYTTRLKE